MATKRQQNRAYGLNNPLQSLAPLVIQSTRTPTTSDFAEIGTTWVYTTGAAVYVLAKIANGSATWTTSPASGVGTFTSVDVTTGNLDVQASGSTTTISSGTIDFDNGAGTTTIAGDLTVAGTTTFTGDIDITTASLYDITATGNQDPAILLRTNGGTTETLQLTVSQGTALDSLDLNSAAGGILLDAVGNTNAAAIKLFAQAGGVTIQGAGAATTLQGDADGASAVIVEATAGGLDLLASGAAAGEDINITATGSSVNINSTEDVANSVVISSTNGGIDITASGADSTDDIDITAAQHVNIVGSTTDDIFTAPAVSLYSATGSIVLETDSTDGTNQGMIIDTATQIDIFAATDSIASGRAAIALDATDANGGIVLRAGADGIKIGDQEDCLIINLGDVDPTASRTITVGGGTIITAAVTDTIDIAPDGATTNADSVKQVTINNGTVAVGQLLTSINAGAVTSGTNTVSIQSGNVTAGTVATNISTGTGTKTVNVGNADAGTTVNVDGVFLVNDSINANTSINTGTSTGTVSIGNAAAGAVTVDTAAGISLDAATASNFSAAAGDLTLAAATNSVVVSAVEDVIDAVQLTASGTNAGVTVTTGALAATSGVNLVQGAANASIQVGAGVPSHNAPKGSLYLNTTGSSTSTRAYIATDAVGTWTAITTAA